MLLSAEHTDDSLCVCVGGALSRPIVSGAGESGQRCFQAAVRRRAPLSPGGGGAAVREGAPEQPVVPGGAAWSAPPPARWRSPSEVAHCGKEE